MSTEQRHWTAWEAIMQFDKFCNRQGYNASDADRRQMLEEEGFTQDEIETCFSDQDLKTAS